MRGSLVAFEFDNRGSVCLQYSNGVGLLRARDGISRVVIDRGDVADIAAIFACIDEELDRDECRARGVEVDE